MLKSAPSVWIFSCVRPAGCQHVCRLDFPPSLPVFLSMHMWLIVCSCNSLFLQIFLITFLLLAHLFFIYFKECPRIRLKCLFFFFFFLAPQQQWRQLLLTIPPAGIIKLATSVISSFLLTDMCRCLSISTGFIVTTPCCWKINLSRRITKQSNCVICQRCLLPKSTNERQLWCNKSMWLKKNKKRTHTSVHVWRSRASTQSSGSSGLWGLQDD